MAIEANTLTLHEQLEERKKQSAAKDPQVFALRQADTQKLIDSGIAEQSLRAGDQALDFTLPDADKQPITLSTLLQQGPVVLTFYRGSWCPYCNIQLHAYQAVLPDIHALGGQLVAISPQTPDHSLGIIDKARLTFPVLSDQGNKVARAYHLVFRLPEALHPYTVNLSEYNGDDSWELPMPGTFIVGNDGIIRLAFVHADYTKRLEPATILDTLRQMV